MKKIYIILLSFIALIASVLCGCVKPDDSPDTFPEYTETQLFEITVGYAQNSVEKGDYSIDIRDLSVVIKDRSDLTNQIYELIKGWRNEAVSACQKLYGAIHYDGDEKEYKIVFNVTYKDNGLLALCCEIGYDEYGEQNRYMFRSAVWDVDREKKLSAEELICYSGVAYEDFLTLNLYPMISDLPDYAVGDLKSDGGKFSESVGFCVAPDGVWFYLSFERQAYPAGYCEFFFSFSDNPKAFKYELSPQTNN